MREQIMNRIAQRGGLYGMIAEMHINDIEKSNQFIIECFEQCHNQSVQDNWGSKLISEILLYRLDLVKELRNRLIEINFKLSVQQLY